MSEGLVYTGKVIKIEEIPGADFVVLAHAVAGRGGLWRGVVRKDEIKQGDKVVVFQPDSVLPADNPVFAFMSKYHFRVRQMKFKGCASEALIMPYSGDIDIGADVTSDFGVTKYIKESTLHFSAETVGLFPSFIPKTDEILAQKIPEIFETMRGKLYVITKKLDGMSSTIFNWENKIGVCSRNLEIKDGPNSIWQVVHKYELDKNVPDGFALQWETVGPGIQKNPMGLEEVCGFCFQVWNIPNHRYLDYEEFVSFTSNVMPIVPLVETGLDFQHSLDSLQELAGTLFYPNKKPAEGLVFRPLIERREFMNREFMRVSAKVINLAYKN